MARPYILDCVSIAGMPRRLGKGLLLLLLPALTIAGAELHRAARGAFFSGPNQDPAYSYLMGSLQVVRHGLTTFYHHPGLPGQGLGAAVLAAGHRLAGEHDDLARDVLSRPESYLRAIQLTTLAMVVAALAAAGFLVRRRGGMVAALLLQAAPLLGARGLSSLSQVGPEAILVFATIALSAAVWHFAATTPGDERAIAIAFGALAAFAFTTRISALPFILVPPLLLKTWRGRAFFAGTAAAGCALAGLLIAQYWLNFLDWALYLGERTGPWGSKPRSLLEPDLYAQGLAFIFRDHHAFFAVWALAGAVWLWHRLRKDGERGVCHRALGIVLFAQAIQVLVVSKTPAARYLIPATVLVGLDLALVWALWTGRGGRLCGRWRAVAALLLVLPAAPELPRHRAELHRLRWGVADQLLIAEEIARLGADCTVAEFFRASSLPFALHFGSKVRPSVFAEELTELYPHELFYNFRRRGFEDFAGPILAAEVERRYPCLALHGFFLPDLAPLIIRRTPVEVLYSVPSLDAVVAE